MKETMEFKKGVKYDEDMMANVVAMVMRRCTDDSVDLEPTPKEDFEVIVKSVRIRKYAMEEG